MVARTLRRTATGLVTAGVLATVLTSPAAADDAPEQWRSYWVDAFNEGIYSPAQVDQLVEDAKAINANALIVQSVRRYDCFCNDALYPRTDAAVSPAPYDPLQEIIDEAHAEGIEVHAWVNVNTLWNSATAPTSPDHIFNTNGLTATGADRWLNKKADGTEKVGNNTYIDPANPAAVDYIVEGIQSIVENYDVDGINLDYVRYPDGSSTQTHSDWGFSETSIARFQEATGRTDVPAASDQEFSDWRRDQMTNLVRRIYLGIFDVDPQARLSMDGITYGYGPQTVGSWEQTRTYAEVLQDWKGWLDEGIMDTVVAMNYKRDFLFDEGNNQNQMFDEWTEFLADNQADRQAVNGPALYLNDLDSIMNQVTDTLTPSAAGNLLAGWSGYSYANPTNTHVGGTWAERSAERDLLAAALTEGADAPFADDAAVPSMSWKETPTTGNIAGTVTANRDGLDQVDVTLKPLTSRGESVTRTTDGSGWYGFVDLEPGLYLVRVDLPRGVVGNPVKVVRVKAGDLADADIKLVDLS